MIDAIGFLVRSHTRLTSGPTINATAYDGVEIE